MKLRTSDEWLERANKFLDPLARQHIVEWRERPETKALQCLLHSNIEKLKEVWEVDENSMFDNAVQNAKARGKVTGFKMAMEYIHDILAHLEEEDEHADSSGTQGSDSTR